MLITADGLTLVGEIKSMNKGVLKIETSFSDSDFSIKWNKIKSINTTTQYLISTVNGRRYNSSLKSADDKLLILKAKDSIEITTLSNIVYLKSIKSNFIDKL